MDRRGDGRAQRTSRAARLAEMVLATLVLTLVSLGTFAGAAFPATHTSTTPGAGAGSLTLEASTEATTPGSSLSVRVANSGAGPVTAVGLTVTAPEGVEATITPEFLPSLPAEASVLAVVSLSGAPTTGLRRLEVLATGTSASGETAAVASVEISAVEPAVTMSIAGNTRLTDASPADLAVMLHNTEDQPVIMGLTGSAGQHEVRLAPAGGDLSEQDLDSELEVELAGQDTALVQVRVSADGPVRRGSVALVVTADVVAADSSYGVTATQSLDTTLSTDVLPSIVGIGSLLFIPGLVAVGVWLGVRAREERRRGLIPQSPVSKVLDNKMWLFAAAGISAVAAFVFSRLGFTNVFDTYALSDILLLSVLCGLLGLAVAKVVVWLESRGVPTLDDRMPEIVTLSEASRFSGLNARSVYKTADGKLGLLVKTLSDDALVLSPPMWFTEMDPVTDALNRSASLSELVSTLTQQKGAAAKVVYAQDAHRTQYISQPVTVRGAVPTGSVQVPILSPRDFEPHNAAGTVP